jgi:hypothetical protein
MTAHDWFIEHRTAYVTRTLETAEEDSFRDHLGRCEECREATMVIERELAWLSMAAAPVAPPPGFQWKAANHALGRRRQSPWARWAPLAAAAVMTIVASVALLRANARETELARLIDSASTREAVLAQQLARANETFAALSDTVEILRGAERVLQAAVAMNNHKGALIIFADEATHRWNVVLHGLPPAPAGEKYQFWFICSDGMLRAAELRPTGDGSTMITVGMPPAGVSVIGASLSVEQVSNASNVPKGPELAHLML